MILKLYEDTSTSKITFSKARAYRLEHIRKELINQEKWNGQNISFKILIVNCDNSILNNFNWGKRSEVAIKEIPIWNRV